MARLLSGRVKVTSPTGVTTDRYDYLDLKSAEPNLGVPSQDNYVLTSDITGNRSWAPAGIGITAVGVSDNDSFVGAATTVNFGANLNVAFSSSGIATITGVGNSIQVAYNDINIGTGSTLINFAGTGISSVTALAGIATITVDLQSNLDGGFPDTNYGGIDAIEGGTV